MITPNFTFQIPISPKFHAGNSDGPANVSTCKSNRHLDDDLLKVMTRGWGTVNQLPTSDIGGGGVQGPPGAPLTEPEPMKQPNLGFGNSLTHLSRSSLLSVQPLPLYSSSYTTLPFMIAIFFNHPNNPLRQWGYSHSADETTETQRSSLACLMPCCSIVEGQKKDVVPDLTASRPKGRPAPLSCGLFWKKNSVHSVDFALGTRSAHQPQRYPFPDPFHPRAEFSNPRPL